MRVLPVIERELRVQARLGFTYGLRVLGATTLLFVCVFFGAREHFMPSIGGRLFGYLNTTLFLSIWIMVPMLAADCLSRERREGTLGLLFMTSLRAREVVLAKVMVHGLRALTLWLAVLPVLTICFLLGGVTWKEAVMSALINFSMICWALAAGLLASSLSRVWIRAQLMACLLGAGLAALFVLLNGYAVLGAAGNDPSFLLPPLYGAYRAGGNLNDQAWGMGLFAVTDLESWWGMLFGSLRRSSQLAWFQAQAGIAVGSVLLLLAAVEIAAMFLRRIWQQNPPPPSRVWLEQQLTTPVVGITLFRRWLRHKLERNPIGWLEQRTWSGRLVIWGWLAALITIYSAALGRDHLERVFDKLQQLLAWMLVISMCATAAGSFRRERETGLLELLLVSPLKSGELILGRLRGLWSQFLPAALIIGAVWLSFARLMNIYDIGDSFLFFSGAFLAVPVIGLYHSLRRPSFVSAFLFTIFWGLLLPVCLRLAVVAVITAVFGEDAGIQSPRYSYYAFGQAPQPAPVDPGLGLLRFLSSPRFTFALQMVLALYFGLKLRRDLEERNFTITRLEV